MAFRIDSIRRNYVECSLIALVSVDPVSIPFAQVVGVFVLLFHTMRYHP